MPGPEFFQTIMGRRFIEGTMPRIADTLEAVAKELKRANDLKEKELEPKIIGSKVKDHEGKS